MCERLFAGISLITGKGRKSIKTLKFIDMKKILCYCNCSTYPTTYKRVDLKKVCLSKLVEIQSGYRARRKIIESPTGTHRLLQARDVNDRGINFESAMKFNPDLDANRYQIYPQDILFIARGYENKAFFVNEIPDKILASNSFYILQVYSNSIHPGFLAWWLNQPQAQDYFAQFQVKSGFSYMSKKNLFNLEVPMYTMDIQEKISMVQQLWKKEKSLTNEINVLKSRLIDAACLSAVNQKEV